jgi:hypothetical protein
MALIYKLDDSIYKSKLNAIRNDSSRSCFQLKDVKYWPDILDRKGVQSVSFVMRG